MVARSHVKWCADRPGVDSVEVDDSCIQADQRASPVHKGCRSPGSVTSQLTKFGWERERRNTECRARKVDLDGF